MQFERTDNLKSDILRLSEILFREKGYDATTFQMMADILGITKGAITYHFKNKHYIFGQLLQEYFNVVKAFTDCFPQDFENHYWRICVVYIFVYRTVLQDPRNERLYFHKDQMFLWESTKVSTIYGLYQAIVSDFHIPFDQDELLARAYMDLGARRRVYEEYSQQNPLFSTINQFCYYHISLIGSLCRLDETTIQANIKLAFAFADSHEPPKTPMFA